MTAGAADAGVHAATLLVAVRPTVTGPSVLLGRGLAREPIVWAFTDPEALGAWGRADTVGTALPPAAVADLAGPAGTVVVNPAGPGGRIVPAADVAQGTSATDADPAGAELLGDVDGRARARAAAAEASRQAAAALQAGDHERAAEAAASAVDACRRIGDLLHTAAAATDLAEALAAGGRAAAAAATAEQSAMLVGALGETDIAIVQLVRAAELAVEIGDPQAAARLAAAATYAAAGPGAGRLAAVWRRLGPEAGEPC